MSQPDWWVRGQPFVPGDILRFAAGAQPVNAIAATAALTITGAVVDGETVTIGDDVYEFDTHDVETVTLGHLRADISGNSTVKAQGTLTVDTQPTAGDTMTIGTTVYTFVAPGDFNANGEISVGTNLSTAQAALRAAINGTDAVNTPHPLVTCGAFTLNAALLTARAGGTAGNSIATTETFTAGTNGFDALTLGTTTAGVDATTEEAIIALLNARELRGTAAVTGTNLGAGVVQISALVAGVSGNGLVALATDAAHASWDDTTLSGGVDGAVGLAGEIRFTAGTVYLCVADNSIHDAHWRRVALDTFVGDGS